MSQENVEIVRRGWDAYESGDLLSQPAALVLTSGQLAAGDRRRRAESLLSRAAAQRESTAPRAPSAAVTRSATAGPVSPTSSRSKVGLPWVT